VNALFVPFVLFITVLASVSFGVAAAYATVLGLVYSFGRTSQGQSSQRQSSLRQSSLRQPLDTHPHLVLVPTQNHVAGD
jgi:hypothetical protein